MVKFVPGMGGRAVFFDHSRLLYLLSKQTGCILSLNTMSSSNSRIATSPRLPRYPGHLDQYLLTYACFIRICPFFNVESQEETRLVVFAISQDAEVIITKLLKEGAACSFEPLNRKHCRSLLCRN